MTTSVLTPASSRVRPRTAALLVGIPVLFVVLSTIGALTETNVPGLPVVPMATLWALPLDLWIRDLATALTVGFILIGGVLAPRPDKRSGSLASLAAIVWLFALLAQSVFTVSEVLALPLSTSVDPTIVWSLLTQTTLGRVMLIQFVLVAIVALLGWVILDRITGSVLLALALIAAFLPGFNGHSGIDDGHSSATISLGLHIVAAAVWIGGLVATVNYAYRHGGSAAPVIRRFSLLALISVIVLAESGLLNAGLRLDGLASLVTSTYGAIIVAKMALLIALIGYGWRQRRNLADRFENDDAKMRVLVLISGTELLWMGAALGLSVALSRTAPAGYAVTGDPLSYASLVMLAIAIPLAVSASFGDAISRRLPQWLREYPEPVAVALLVVMAGSAASTSLFGPQLSAIVTIVMVVGVGTVCVSVAGRSIPALAILAAGLPVIAWWIENGIEGGLSWSTVVVTLVGWGLLVLARRIRRPQRVEVGA